MAWLKVPNLTVTVEGEAGKARLAEETRVSLVTPDPQVQAEMHTAGIQANCGPLHLVDCPALSGKIIFNNETKSLPVLCQTPKSGTLPLPRPHSSRERMVSVVFVV